MKKVIVVSICLLSALLTDALWAAAPVCMRGVARSNAAQEAPGATLEGTVLSRIKKAPLRDISVALVQRDQNWNLNSFGGRFRASTDPAGRFRITDVPPGTYLIDEPNPKGEFRSNFLESADGKWAEIKVLPGAATYSFGKVYLMDPGELAPLGLLCDAPRPAASGDFLGDKLLVLFRHGEDPWGYNTNLQLDLSETWIPESPSLVCIHETGKQIGGYAPVGLPAYDTTWYVKVVRLSDGMAWNKSFTEEPPKESIGMPVFSPIGQLRDWLTTGVR